MIESRLVILLIIDDSLIPGTGNPLAWDRYAYTLNAPTRYTDPSGHMQPVADDSLILRIGKNR